MSERNSPSERPELGVILVGVGAVATTLVAGIVRIRQGAGLPVGSVTQLERWPTGAPGGSERVLGEAIGATPLARIAFAGFDLLENCAFESAKNARVLGREDLEGSEDALKAMPVWPGIGDSRFLPSLDPVHTIEGESSREKIDFVKSRVREFLDERGCERGVVVLCHSVEALSAGGDFQGDLDELGRELLKPHAESCLSPTQLYAIAAFESGLPLVNATPNSLGDCHPLKELARSREVPFCGEDLKSGQTYMKSVIASALRERLLGVKGWFSTNLLGNRDGLVLNDRDSFASKERTKSGVLAPVLSPDEYPDLYRDLEHQVHIRYFPPKGDAKEAWDDILLFGWLGYDMELKVNFLCRDSILAAPLLLDLILLADGAARRGESGVLDWLAPFFKAPLDHEAARCTTTPAEQSRELRRVLDKWTDVSGE